MKLWPLAAVLLVTTAARAHIAPSPDANNRYLKVTVLGDEVRVAYLIFFGDRPGASERRVMDANHDGQIDAGEARRFGESILAQVSPTVSLRLDGEPAAAAWTVADVGLGTPTASGGAFSVDLVVHAAWPDPARAEHTLSIDDALKLPNAGEHEIRIDESPGVRVRGSDGRTAFVYSGNPAGPGERALDFAVTVDEAARGKSKTKGGPPWWPFAAGGAVLLLLAVGGVALSRSRR